MDTVRYELNTLNRQFSLYAKTRVSLANNLIALLDQSFPGVNRWFDSPARKDGSQKWVDKVGNPEDFQVASRPPRLKSKI